MQNTGWGQRPLGHKLTKSRRNHCYSGSPWNPGLRAPGQPEEFSPVISVSPPYVSVVSGESSRLPGSVFWVFYQFPTVAYPGREWADGNSQKMFELVDQGKGAKSKGPRGWNGDWTRETGTAKGPVSHLNLLWEGMLNSAVINWSQRRFSLWLARLQRRNTGFKCCAACWYSFNLT